MPVRKFRNLLDMEDALWRRTDDPDLSSAIARVWEFADRVSERRFPAGVYKHRSIEDAQELRDRWEEENFRAHWKRNQTVPREDSHDG